MSEPIHAVALQMYTALRALPCGCCRKWDKESKTEDGWTQISTCSRCHAMRAYEATVQQAMV